MGIAGETEDYKDAYNNNQGAKNIYMMFITYST